MLLLIALVIPLSATAQSITLDNGTLSVASGTIDLAGGTLTAATAGTLDETSGRVTGGRLTTTRTLDAPTSKNVAGLGTIITSAADLGQTTITRGHTAQTAESHAGIERYYEVAPTNDTGLDATLVCSYAELVLFRSTDGGTTWVREGGKRAYGSQHDHPERYR